MFKYREAVASVTPKQKVTIIYSFSKLLSECVYFLGLRCISEYLVCFVGFLCDAVPIVRDVARKGWKAFKSHLIHLNGDMYGQVLASMKQKFLDALRSAAKISQSGVGGSGEGSALAYELRILLGLGTIAGDQMKLLAQVSRIDDYDEQNEDREGKSSLKKGIILSLIQLSLPDLNSLRTIVLQSRRYFNNTRSATLASVECGYYRLQWCGTNDDAIKSQIRKVSVLMGING